MFSTRHPREGSPLAELQRLAKKLPTSEQCDFCSVPLGPSHRHLLEVATRKILCTCDPCGLRFEGVVGGRYKLIPRRGRSLPDFRVTDEQWAGLALPIDLAFILYSSTQQKPVAFYPSPAGVIESLLPLHTWSVLVTDNPRLRQMEPDTEAFLANRTANAQDYYVAPIDACFELAGLVRLHWRGLTGGTAVWKEVQSFFAKLKSTAAPGRATRPREVTHA